MGGTVLSVRDAKVSETVITPGLGGLRGMGHRPLDKRSVNKETSTRSSVMRALWWPARGALHPHSDTKQASWWKRPLG